jgi:hypothetical protein
MSNAAAVQRSSATVPVPAGAQLALVERQQAAPDLTEVGAAGREAPDAACEVVDRAAAPAREAAPAALPRRVDVEARSLVVMERAVHLAVASGPCAEQVAHVHRRRDRQQRARAAVPRRRPSVARSRRCRRAKRSRARSRPRGTVRAHGAGAPPAGTPRACDSRCPAGAESGSRRSTPGPLRVPWRAADSPARPAAGQPARRAASTRDNSTCDHPVPDRAQRTVGAPRPGVGAFGPRARANFCAWPTPSPVEIGPRLVPVSVLPPSGRMRLLAGLFCDRGDRI